MTLKVEVDGSQFGELAKVIRALGKDAAPAMARAVNHTGAKALTQVTRTLTAQTGLNRKVIVKALRVEKAVAARGTSAFIIRGGGGNISLKYFGAGETTEGVNAAPLGDRQLYTGAFMKAGGFRKGRVSKPNWNGQVFRRTGGKTNTGKDKFEKVRSGVYIAEQMVTGATAEAFQTVVRRDLPGRIQHEILRALDGAK